MECKTKELQGILEDGLVICKFQLLEESFGKDAVLNIKLFVNLTQSPLRETLLGRKSIDTETSSA